MALIVKIIFQLILMFPYMYYAIRKGGFQEF